MNLMEDLELGRVADSRLADGQELLRVNILALCVRLPFADPGGSSES